MERTHRDIIVGVFTDHRRARQAIHELKRAGWTSEQIGMARRSDEDESEELAGTFAEEGAVTGLAAGAGIGALWGLAIAAGFLPGIGPAIAGGTLGVLLSSAAAGAAVAGLAGALIGLGIPEDEAEYYEGEFKAGRTIVTVQHNAAQHDLVRTILQRFGAYDIDARDSHTMGDAEDLSSETHAGRRTIEMPVRKEDVVVDPTPNDMAGGDIRMPVHKDEVRIGDHGDVIVEREKPMGRS